MTASLRAPRPLTVLPVLRQDRAALIALLSELSPEDWVRPTVCAGWNVRDVALHLLGGDLGNLARRRDGLRTQEPDSTERLGAFLARMNQTWVESARRLSPHLTIELLAITGPLLADYFATLDPNALGERVSWVSQDPAPVWLDLAREYMECWVHQQHIRDAVNRPGQSEATYCAPVIAASMHALPKAVGGQPAPAGTNVVVLIEGDAGGVWSVVKDSVTWGLFEGAAKDATASIALTADDWWRVVTLGLSPDEAWRRAHVRGDQSLTRAALGAVAIIA